MTDMNNLDIDFDEWMEYGIKKGFCGPAVCYTHDGLPMSDEEWMEEEASGEPPCMHIIRLYEDDVQKKQIEDMHAPSVWRNHYRDRGAVAVKNSFANQVRIALIVAKSLLKKATEANEISREQSELVQEHLNSAYTIIKQVLNKETD